MNEYGIQRFEHWKQDGLLRDYRFLFNWYVDVDTWDAMAVLSFPSYAQIARWKDIERISPGGLMRDALDMAWPLNSYPSDLVSSTEPDQPHSAAQSVFFVVPYDKPDGSEFAQMVNTWVVPNAKASMQEGILAGYQVFRTRYAGGKRWQGLLVLEYKDFDSFARRDEVNARIASRIPGNPAWRAAAHEPVIADALLPR